MKNFKKLTILLSIAIVILFVVLIIKYSDDKPEKPDLTRDYTEIVESDTIVALVSTNPIDYFIYQGRPMGFQLEILEHFANDHNLVLEIVVDNDIISGVDKLMSRECDILAQSITATTERDLVHDFTIPVRQTKQVLVQRKPEGFEMMHYKQIEDSLIRDLDNLESITLFASKGSISMISLQNLSTEIGENFYVEEIDSMSPEQIVNFVSIGKFDYAVCDENIAKIAQAYYPNIDVKTELSFPQNISWGVRPESTELLDTLNTWLEEFKETPEYTKYYRRYINNNRILVDINSEFYSGNEGKISNYDDILKKYSHIAGWDWRLLASLIYQESRFNENAVSWAGAHGLMQLMPFIYEKFAPDSVSGVEAHVAAGVNYIAFLYTKLPETATDSTDQLKLLLAGYNIGYGHVEDAIRLAKKYDKNTGSWEDVSYFITNLSNPKYFNDTCVKHGAISGIYAVNFANSIANRYQHYKNVIPE